MATKTASFGYIGGVVLPPCCRHFPDSSFYIKLFLFNRKSYVQRSNFITTTTIRTLSSSTTTSIPFYQDQTEQVKNISSSNSSKVYKLYHLNEKNPRWGLLLQRKSMIPPIPFLNPNSTNNPLVASLSPSFMKNRDIFSVPSSINYNKISNDTNSGSPYSLDSIKPETGESTSSFVDIVEPFPNQYFTLIPSQLEKLRDFQTHIRSFSKKGFMNRYVYIVPLISDAFSNGSTSSVQQKSDEFSESNIEENDDETSSFLSKSQLDSYDKTFNELIDWRVIHELSTKSTENEKTDNRYSSKIAKRLKSAVLLIEARSLTVDLRHHLDLRANWEHLVEAVVFPSINTSHFDHRKLLMLGNSFLQLHSGFTELIRLFYVSLEHHKSFAKLEISRELLRKEMDGKTLSKVILESKYQDWNDNLHGIEIHELNERQKIIDREEQRVLDLAVALLGATMSSNQDLIEAIHLHEKLTNRKQFAVMSVRKRFANALRKLDDSLMSTSSSSHLDVKHPLFQNVNNIKWFQLSLDVSNLEKDKDRRAVFNRLAFIGKHLYELVVLKELCSFGTGLKFPTFLSLYKEITYRHQLVSTAKSLGVDKLVKIKSDGLKEYENNQKNALMSTEEKKIPSDVLLKIMYAFYGSVYLDSLCRLSSLKPWIPFKIKEM